MIAKMKKVYIVGLEKNKSSDLEKLGLTELVHVDKKPASSQELTALEEKKSALEKAVYLLPAADKKAKAPDFSLTKSLKLAEELHGLADEKASINETLSRLAKDSDFYKNWSSFDPADLEYLKGKENSLKLYELSKEEFKNLPEEADFFLLPGSKKIKRVAFLNTEEKYLPLSGEVQLPELSAKQTEAKAAVLKMKLESINSYLKNQAAEAANLKTALTVIKEELDFEAVRAGLLTDESLSCIKGFIPAKKTGELKKAAEANEWAILIEDPSSDDAVPSLIENPAWVRIIDPVFRFLDITPGYREFDISFWFLLFFSIYFAMLIGDAGYGLIFLGITLFARIKMPKAPAAPFVLLTVLSTATIIWGALSGVWFGSKTLIQIPFLQNLVLPQLSAADPASKDLIINICFILGALQLTVAHAKRMISMFPSLPFMAEAGSLALLWGMYFMIQYLVLREPLNPAAGPMIFGGFMSIVIFSEQKGNFIQGVKEGFSLLILKILNSISFFADIVSYIRLFAVGLATLAVAESFNAMGGDFSSVTSGLISALILFLGHTLNILMAALAIVVHGVRLNVLEFSGHLGMEWSGFRYAPFKGITNPAAKKL